MKVKTIKEILDIYLEKPEFKEIKEINKINKYWKNIVGELIYKNTEIIKKEKGNILIKTKNPAWRNELSLQKEHIINKLNKIKDLKIKDIKFK